MGREGSVSVTMAAFPWGGHLHIEVCGTLDWGFYGGLITSCITPSSKRIIFHLEQSSNTSLYTSEDSRND